MGYFAKEEDLFAEIHMGYFLYIVLILSFGVLFVSCYASTGTEFRQCTKIALGRCGWMCSLQAVGCRECRQ